MTSNVALNVRTRLFPDLIFKDYDNWWTGFQNGLLFDYVLQAYITCSWGVGNVGYVMICYGVCDAIASISFGPVIRHLGRVPVFVLGAILNFSMILTMMFWRPDPTTPYIFFAIAGIWGVGDAIWQTQINGTPLVFCKYANTFRLITSNILLYLLQLSMAYYFIKTKRLRSATTDFGRVSDSL